MRLFLLVRASLPWDQLNYRSYQNQAGFFAGRWMYRVNRSLTAWQDIFDMSFFEYRHRIYQIAQRNWGNILGLEDIFMSDGGHDKTLDMIRKIRKIKDAMILPVDDDDWFSPKIKQELEPYSHHPIIHWRQGRYDPYADRNNNFVLRNAEPYHFFTNNYAYTPFLYSFVNEFHQAEMTLMHLHFNDIVRNTIFEPVRCNWITLPKCFGVTNKTLASLSKLNKKKSAKHFLACMGRHQKLSSEKSLCTAMEWAPWIMRSIKETEELHHELKESLKCNLRSS